MSTAKHSLGTSINAFINLVDSQIYNESLRHNTSFSTNIRDTLDDPAIVDRLAHHYGNRGYVVYVSKKENKWWLDISWKSPE